MYIVVIFTALSLGARDTASWATPAFVTAILGPETFANLVHLVVVFAH